MKDWITVIAGAGAIATIIAVKLLVYAAIFVVLTKLAFGWFGGF